MLISDIRVSRGVDISSDHQLVTTILKLNLSLNRKGQRTEEKKVERADNPKPWETKK